MKKQTTHKHSNVSGDRNTHVSGNVPGNYNQIGCHIHNYNGLSLEDLVNTLIKACGLLPDKMELQISFIVNSTVVSGSHNSNLANR